jgi:hypothetical protein
MPKRNALVLITALAVFACDDEDDGVAAKDDGASGLPKPTTDEGASTAPDCYTKPTTYLELINACTDAEKVVKTPVLPLLLADGGLPPLP